MPADWNDDDWRAIRMLAKPTVIVYIAWALWWLLNTL
jgi:hypothetical protein